MYGAKKYNKIATSLYNGLLISLIGACVFFVLRFFLGPLLNLIDPSLNVQTAAKSYLMIRFLGAFGFFGSIVFASSFRAINLSKIVLITSIIANITNIILDYLLIFTFQQGLEGAAIATVISQWLCLGINIVFYAFYNFQRVGINVNIKQLPRFDIKMLRKLISVGMPYSLKFFSEVMIFFFFIMMTGWVSDKDLAATTIMLQIVILTNMTASGIGYSAQVLVGQEIGKKDFNRAKVFGRYCIELNLIITMIVSVLIIILAKPIIHLFNEDIGVINVFLTITVLGGFVIVGDGLQIVAGNALNGACDTKIQFKYMMLFGYLVFLPLCYMLTVYIKLGAFGAWLAMAFFIILLSSILMHRFYAAKWKMNCVLD